MFSTRKAAVKAVAGAATSALAAVLSLGGASGCKARAPQPMQTHEPTVVDEAMQHREWDRSEAYFLSGAVRTYRDRNPYTYDTTRNNARFTGALLDFPALVYTAVRLPFTYLFYPPFSTRVDPGLQVNETYTGVPPLRADPGGATYGRVGASIGGMGGSGTGGTGAGGTDGTGAGVGGGVSPGGRGTGAPADGAGGAPGGRGSGAGDTGTPGGAGGAGGAGGGR